MYSSVITIIGRMSDTDSLSTSDLRTARTMTVCRAVRAHNLYRRAWGLVLFLEISIEGDNSFLVLPELYRYPDTGDLDRDFVIKDIGALTVFADMCSKRTDKYIHELNNLKCMDQEKLRVALSSLKDAYNGI